jgi:hypothetical protein
LGLLKSQRNEQTCASLLRLLEALSRGQTCGLQLALWNLWEYIGAETANINFTISLLDLSEIWAERLSVCLLLPYFEPS